MEMDPPITLDAGTPTSPTTSLPDGHSKKYYRKAAHR